MSEFPIGFEVAKKVIELGLFVEKGARNDSTQKKEIGYVSQFLNVMPKT